MLRTIVSRQLLFFAVCIFFSLLLASPRAAFSFRYERKTATGDCGFSPGTTEWYITQGNNTQVVLHTSGQHRVWVEQKSIIWPRGSGEKVMGYTGLWYGGIGHFSNDTKLDTNIARHNGSAHNPGRIATNSGGVNTREGDLEGWPPEFRTDVDGDGKGDIAATPIVLSDEDVICIHFFFHSSLIAKRGTQT